MSPAGDGGKRKNNYAGARSNSVLQFLPGRARKQPAFARTQNWVELGGKARRGDEDNSSLVARLADQGESKHCEL